MAPDTPPGPESRTGEAPRSGGPPPGRLSPPSLRALLPEIGSDVAIAPLDGARLLQLNKPLADALRLTVGDHAEPAAAHGAAASDSPREDGRLAQALTRIASGSDPECRQGLATVYSGHQFGLWAGQLGDGRACIVGSLVDAEGVEQEVQLKGAGRTPYSRFADGRAVVRSTVREYLASEALHGLGIPTTRALAIVTADTPVQREQIERAAVLYRVAPSHLRFGHFEHFAAAGNHDMLLRLARYLMKRFWPGLDDGPDGIRAWLGDVLARTADTVAAWQAVGFCHGVMNTDNFSMLGLTLDYGPFGFLEAFEPGHVCNHSDHEARYAWDRQPAIAQWNCARLLSACLPLLGEAHDDTSRRVAIAEEILEGFARSYREALLARFRAKLGLATACADDSALIEGLLERLRDARADYTRAFRALADVAALAVPEASTADPGRGAAPASEDLPEALDGALSTSEGRQWLASYRKRLSQPQEQTAWLGHPPDATAPATEPAPTAKPDPETARAVVAHRKAAMLKVNPRFVLRNWLAQQAITAAEAGDAAPLERLRDCLSRPFDDQPEHAELDAPAPDWAAGLSVSCSS